MLKTNLGKSPVSARGCDMERTNTDRKLYTIGQVSDILDIPIRTIRYYESVELAKAYLIDAETNYRYYSLDEIFHLDLVRCLGRELGMPLKKIREYLELQQEQGTLKQYLIEQADEIDGRINMMLARKNFLLSKLRAVTLRELTQTAAPGIVMRGERKLFMRRAELLGLEDTILTLRTMLKETKKEYDRTAFLLREFNSDLASWNDFDDVLIGVDDRHASVQRELVLPEGKYAEVIYENRLDKREEAMGLFLRFLMQSGFEPEGFLIFSATLLEAISVRSDSYYFKIEVKLKAGSATRL
jgi:DNA-binding transcriptional MerR regulator